MNNDGCGGNVSYSDLYSLFQECPTSDATCCRAVRDEF